MDERSSTFFSPCLQLVKLKCTEITILSSCLLCRLPLDIVTIITDSLSFGPNFEVNLFIWFVLEPSLSILILDENK